MSDLKERAKAHAKEIFETRHVKSFNMIYELLEHIEQLEQRNKELEQANEWISVEVFKKSPSKICWIKYKGAVKIAYYNKENDWFTFEDSHHCYMTECISGVSPIEAPKQ